MLVCVGVPPGSLVNRLVKQKKITSFSVFISASFFETHCHPVVAVKKRQKPVLSAVKRAKTGLGGVGEEACREK